MRGLCKGTEIIYIRMLVLDLICCDTASKATYCFIGLYSLCLHQWCILKVFACHDDSSFIIEIHFTDHLLEISDLQFVLQLKLGGHLGRWDLVSQKFNRTIDWHCQQHSDAASTSSFTGNHWSAVDLSHWHHTPSVILYLPSFAQTPHSLIVGETLETNPIHLQQSVTCKRENMRYAD